MRTATPTDVKWQWARSADMETWTDIDGATSASRMPVNDDVGSYLRATVTYTDTFDSGKSASAVTDNTVEALTLANAAPSFEGQDQTGPTKDDDTGTTGIQDHIIISRNVDENTAVGSAIGAPVSASDDDGDVLIYTLDWSPDLRTGSGTADTPSGDARFTIDRATGQIKVGKKLNYEATDNTADKDENSSGLTADTVGGALASTNVENNEEYVLRVRATDPSGAYSNVNVTINLKDANEAPEIPKTRQSDVTVVEGGRQLLQPTSDGTSTENLADGSFVATDLDQVNDANEAIAEYKVEGADAKHFSITPPADDGTGGAVLSINATGDNAHTPNYEKQSSYSITIVAISGTGDRRLAGKLDVTIKVTNAEDRGSVELSQIEPREGRAVTATLMDEDGSISISTWQWQYVALNDGAVCNPGENQTGPSGTWADIPNATSASYTPKDFVANNASIDIANKCLRATATYTDGIASTTNFPAEPTSNTEPDTATEESDAVVQAASAVNAAPEFPDQDLTTPGDQSDETSRSIAENTAADTSIGAAVTAEDEDLRLYSLGGTDADSFAIDRRTGQIKTKAALDFETKAAHMVTVVATDPSGATDSINVTINVTDENDKAVITGGKSVDYNENGTGSVATFTATDQDGDAIEWSLDGQNAAQFTIDGGVLSFKESPNYESPASGVSGTIAERNVYSVTVKATGGELAVTVTVINVDEAGTVSLTQYQPQVGRSLVASVTDPDSDATNQKWQWARSSDMETWTDIDGATNPSRSPTSDDAGHYLRASVTYTDSFGSGKTASAVTDNAVEDLTLANAAPSFEIQDQTEPTKDDDNDTTGIQDYIIVSRSVAENTAVGAAIGAPVSASDEDGDVLIYTLDWSPDLRTGSGSEATPSGDARFSIDRATGQIKAGIKLDYESADGSSERDEATTADDMPADTTGGARAAANEANNRQYVLRVRATDPSGAYSNVNVTITLTDVNEVPTFAEATADPRTAITVVEDTTQLLEATADGTQNLQDDTFVATDPDTRAERPTNLDTTAPIPSPNTRWKAQTASTSASLVLEC